MRNRRGGVVRYNQHVYTYSDWFGEGAEEGVDIKTGQETDVAVIY